MKILIACLLLFALGLASAAPQIPYNIPFRPTDLGGYYDLETQGKGKNLENEVNNQAIGTALQLLPIITKGIAKFVLCKKVTQLQDYTNNEERDAQIMALINTVDELFGVKEADKLYKKNGRIAKAELFDLVKELAKDYLCD